MDESEKETLLAESEEADGDPRREGRRDALKKMLAAGGVVAATSTLPGKWNPAVMEVAAQQGLSPVGPGTTPPAPTTTEGLPPTVKRSP